MIYGGIDPGNQGAIVARRWGGDVVHCEKMPIVNIGRGKKNRWVLDDAALLATLRMIRHLDDDLHFIIEKAQPMPGQGVVSMFNYGGQYHALKMALLACGIPFDVTHPKSWQKKVLHGIEGTDTKARAILKVQRSLPEVNLLPTPRSRKPSEGIADAACMMLYAEHIRPMTEQDLFRARRQAERLPAPPPVGA